MRNIFSTTLQIFAALAAVAFSVVTAPSLAAFNLERGVFNPELYKRSLARQGIYQRIAALAAEQIVTQQGFEQTLEPGDPRRGPTIPHLQTLQQSDYEAILAEVLGPDWAQEQVESIIDQIFVYWNTDADQVDVSISLASIKTRLTGDVVVRIFSRVLATWPECDLGELLGWGGVATGASLEDLPVCRPPDALTQTVLPIVAGLLGEGVLTEFVNGVASAAVTQVPDEVVIFQVPKPPELIFPPAKPPIPKAQMNLGRWLARLSPLLALALLAATVVLGARSLKGLLLWSGVPLLTAGALGVLAAGAVYLSLPQLVQGVVPGILDPPVSQGLLAIALQVGADVSRPGVITMGVESLVLAGAGVLLALGGGAAAFWTRGRS